MATSQSADPLCIAAVAALIVAVILRARYKKQQQKKDKRLAEECRRKAALAASRRFQSNEQKKVTETPTEEEESNKSSPVKPDTKLQKIRTQRSAQTPREKTASKSADARKALLPSKDTPVPDTRSNRSTPSPPPILCRPVRPNNNLAEHYSDVDDLSPMVYNDGMTRFLHVPQLPSSVNTHTTLQRLAREFMPIIRRRGYKVKIVSEFCCCTDGVDSSFGFLGGGKKIKAYTCSGSEDLCDGYNTPVEVPLTGQVFHVIYLRLRHRHNHYTFRTYEENVTTMAHELAHCRHKHHTPEFWKLMEEIEEEYRDLVASGEVSSSNPLDDFGGFNIYGK